VGDMQDSIDKFEQFFKTKKYYGRLLEIAKEYPDKRSVLVDFADIDKSFPNLADDLLLHPEEALRQAQDAISEIDLPIDVENLSINVRLHNLPKAHTIVIRDVRSDHLDRLISVEGIVKNAAEVRPKALKVTFECPECKTNMVLPQFTKNMVSPSQCDNFECARRGRFKIINETLIDSQILKVQEAPESIFGGEQPSELYVHLSDDLVSPPERKKVMPGNRVQLVGSLKKVPIPSRSGAQTVNYDFYLEVNHVDPTEQEFQEIDLSDEDIEKIKKFSKDPKIYEKLIASIAPSIRGNEAIKEAILLQLMGGVRKQHPDGTLVRGNVHIFIVGDPAVGKSQILRYVSGLAPKGRFVSGKKASGVGLTAAVVRDDFAGGWTLEAGALILANNGIVSVDEFDKMSDDDRSAMLEAMEQGTISIAKAGIVTTLRANTSVLAAANPKYGRFDVYKPLYEQIDLSPVILSRFDLKFTSRDLPGSDKDTLLSEHVLTALISPKTIEPEISSEFIQKYVAYARNLDPEMTEKAKELIQHFYVSWRGKYRDDDDNGGVVPLTPRQLEAMVRLSEASARIRLAKKVSLNDAKRATKLIEQSLRDLGTDPETGKIDIDRMEAGTSSVQRSRINTILTIIDELSKEQGPNIKIDDVLIEAANRGIDNLKAVELISKLKSKGDLFEPRQGILKKP
tara:strand:+ start:574 stop:2619 length:2046 start_codon:yes stop_codon:yes gene_type:complete